MMTTDLARRILDRLRGRTAKRPRPISRLLLAMTALVTCSSAALAEDGVSDPIEPFNRGIFWFNEKVDIYAMEPVARGWHWLMPDPVETGVTNFFSNLHFPVVLLNNLLQGKVVNAGSEIGRFVVNTTVGVGGFLDFATDWGMPRHEEDMGQTFGVWGIPPGPYLVLPFWGPSNFRDGVGIVGDSFATVYPWFVPWYYSAPAQGLRVVNARAQVLDEVAQAREASFDFYSAARQAYGQRRKTLIADGEEPTRVEQEDLYNIDPE